MRKKHEYGGSLFPAAMILFVLTAFALPALRADNASAFLPALAAAGILTLISLLLPRLLHLDRSLLNLTALFSVLSLWMLFRFREESLIPAFAACGFSFLLLPLCALWIHRLQREDVLPLILAGVTPVLLLLAVFVPLPFRTDVTLMPLFVLSLAGLLNQRWLVLSLVFILLCPVLLAFGGAFFSGVLWLLCGLAMLCAASGTLTVGLLAFLASGILIGAGISLLPSASAALSSWLALLKGEVSALSPASPEALSLAAAFSGGWFGTGIGFEPYTLFPESCPAFLPLFFSTFGWVCGLCLLLLFALLVTRCASAAADARSSFPGLIALGCAVMLGLQGLFSAGGSLGLLPWNGIPFPLTAENAGSYASGLCLLGFVSGVQRLNREALDEDSRLTMIAR